MKEILEIDHPIFEACIRGDAAFVESEIKRGISVYAKSSMNPSLAGHAIPHNRIEVIKVLLKHGYDPNKTRNIIGESALMQALGKQSAEMITLLIAAGADVNAVDNVGQSSLMRAAGGGNVELCNLLVECGANVNLVGAQNFTAFYFACDGGYVSVMDYLHQQGADIHIRNADKETCLIRAARKGHAEAVSWLLQHGLDPADKDRRGQDAKFGAEKTNNFVIINLLNKAMQAKE